MLNIGQSNKDTLAKLLAMENITVLHKKVPTAYFDVKSRTLVCPILKDDMSDELYDLFMGHEVGHALNTPLKGWHSAVSKEGPIFKGYLNVIEDCRIEQLIKDKYPGLRRSFYTGYDELAYDNFFGIKGKDLTELNLIDKINIHFKIGAQARVRFTEEERPYIIRAKNLKNFKEVMTLATELFELQKEKTEEELKSMTQEQLEDLMLDFDIDIDNESEGEASETMTIEVEGEKSEEETDSEGSGSGEEAEDGEKSEENTDKKGGKSPEEQLEDKLNKSNTDEEFRNNEGKLHKELQQYDRAPTYHELTNKIKYDNFTIPWKQVDELINADPVNKYSRPLNRDPIKKYVKRFVDNNKKIVNYMVKEFEMKKAAAAYKRSSSSKTGELNMDKLHFYQIKDDIFNRIQVIPEGKNHGVVMIIDWSGSMTGSVKATVEQAALLSMFCRRLQIPFRLFAFSDHVIMSEKNRSLIENNENWRRDRIYGKPNPMSPADHDGADWDLGNLSLLEIFNEKMNNVEFIRNMENWFQVAHSTDCYYDDWKTRDNYDKDWRCPYELNLGGTPLDASIVVMRDYLQDFKRSYGLDILTFITLTDGESHSTFHGSKPHLVDRRNNKVITLSNDRYYGRHTHRLLEWVKDTTGCRTIGFFLTKCGPQAFYRDVESFCGAKINGYDEYSEEKRKEFNKLSTSFIDGCYDLAIIINQRKIEIDYEKDELNVEAGATKGKLKSALVKAGSNKMKQRVILNQFVRQMAV